MFNLAVFISGRGSNLAAIMAKQQQFGYRVNLVVSQNENAKGLHYATDNNIPIYTFKWDKTDTQLLHLQKIIQQHDIQLLVLAGFMKILPEAFIQAFAHKIINIHPSLLPKYPGLHTHQRVIANQDTVHGATVHYVNAQLDAGYIISQGRIAVDGIKDAEILAKKLLLIEHSLLPRTIALIAQNRLTWLDNVLYFEQQPLIHPIMLND